MILSIGLDIAKEKIDIHSNSNASYAQIKNSTQVIKDHFKDVDRSNRIVMEATGKGSLLFSVNPNPLIPNQITDIRKGPNATFGTGVLR